jgi:hypothetical protein
MKALFERWAIPIQLTKWAAKNTNGLNGLAKVTILGLAYDLKDFSVGIPNLRKSEIMDELQELERRQWRFKELESTLGILGWAATAIPEIKMGILKRWNGSQSILENRWIDGSKEGYDIEMNWINPAF